MIIENLGLLQDQPDWAVLSADGLHRFRLDRRVAEKGPRYAFIGVNPSTADATIDDATVRKWRGFVKRWGGSSFSVVNLFSWRATDVKDLASCPEPNRENASDIHFHEVLQRADIIVPCWGSVTKLHKKSRPRAELIKGRLSSYGKPTMCFGLTNGGDPKHPLMLGYDTALIPFE